VVRKLILIRSFVSLRTPFNGKLHFWLARNPPTESKRLISSLPLFIEEVNEIGCKTCTAFCESLLNPLALSPSPSSLRVFFFCRKPNQVESLARSHFQTRAESGRTGTRIRLHTHKRRQMGARQQAVWNSSVKKEKGWVIIRCLPRRQREIFST
jgi:hypothetical protein